MLTCFGLGYFADNILQRGKGLCYDKNDKQHRQQAESRKKNRK